jgi:hypothetical protein
VFCLFTVCLFVLFVCLCLFVLAGPDADHASLIEVLFVCWLNLVGGWIGWLVGLVGWVGWLVGW